VKKLILLSISAIFLFSSELFFTPFESQQALKKLLTWIDQAHYRIDVAMYSFTNKTIAKRLKNAARRGVCVRVILDHDQNVGDRYSQIGYLAKYENIFVYTIRGKKLKRRDDFGKMHMKLAIIDSKRLIFGSANWSNSAFKRNYELIYFIEDYALAKKSTKTFERILRKAKRY
jgi:phosphatidylserine/phosphatidylglycerophosphate/cardiolipin synthase-like enzyme